jgi:hypothetical protein
MKILLLAATLCAVCSVNASAQTIQEYSINPYPSPSASSNDRSRNPSAAVWQSYNESFRGSQNYYARPHVRRYRRVYVD